MTAAGSQRTRSSTGSETYPYTIVVLRTADLPVLTVQSDEAIAMVHCGISDEAPAIATPLLADMIERLEKAYANCKARPG